MTTSSTIAVIGVGAITSQGPTAADLWDGARAGRVAINPVQHLDMTGFQTKIGGEVTVEARTARTYRRPPGHRERALDFALVAADEAMAALPAGTVERTRIGLVLGTCNAGLLSAREWLRHRAAGDDPDPRLAALVTPGALADALAAAFGLRGPVLAVNTACASGANAIGLAADLLRVGRADAVLAGGTDALSDIVFAGFSALQSLSPTPAAPYSGNRQGLSLGEGSGMVLLVRADFAKEHGLEPIVEVAGYGLSADGFHATAPRPDGSGAALAIRAAVCAAGAGPDDVGYVNGHGTGTPKNDSAESNAIALALGPAASRLRVSSTKSVIGHLLGAAGAVEAIVTMNALRDQVAPPTAGYDEQDPQCPLDYTPNDAQPLDTDVAISNNFAFGGANASLVLNRPGALTPPAPDVDDVVITGRSALTAAGADVEAAWAAVQAGRDVHELRDGYRVGEVDLQPDAYLTRRERRRMDRLSVLSVVSAAQALADAGIEARSETAAGCGILFGTGAGPVEAIERFAGSVLAHGADAADPGVFPNTVYNQAAGQVAMHLGLRGPTSTLSVGHATAAAVLVYAADLLRAGRADRLVVTVSDALTDELVSAYAACGMVSARTDGAAPDGRFGLTEASVSLVLERRRAAHARGVTVHAQVAGAGFASDARPGGGWDPHGSGVERAMRLALFEAGIDRHDVGSVWLAAAGLTSADEPEAAAVTRLFGTAPQAPHRQAPKRELGEPAGVGAALAATLAIRSWADHPAGAAQPALVNSSSLTGSHICLLLTPPTEEVDA